MKKNYLLIIGTVFSAFTGFAQPDERMTLVETFTSSTCPPCVGGNIVLEDFLAQPENSNKTVSLKYQMSWPGSGDPYYTAEGGIRRNVYSVSGVPNTVLDGAQNGNFQGGPSNLAQGDFDAAYAITPDINVDAFYQIDEQTQTVSVQVDLEAFTDFPPSARIYIAIFEYETFNNTGSNGETEFAHVMKKMVGVGAAGNSFGGMNSGEIEHFEYSYTFNGSYVLPPDANSPIDHAQEHSIEEFSDLGVAVWVQNAISREVHQATYAVPGFSPLSVSENSESLTSAKIYPNPASDNAAIAFHSTMVQDVMIDVYSADGQLVYQSSEENVEIGRTVHEFSTEGLASGLYSVAIHSDSGSIMKKLSVR